MYSRAKLSQTLVLDLLYLFLREEVRREGHEMRLAQGFFSPFCLRDAQKRRNRTLAPSNSVTVLPLLCRRI